MIWKKEWKYQLPHLPMQQTPNDGKGDPDQVKPYLSSKIISDNKIVWMDNSNGFSQIKMRYINSDPLLLLCHRLSQHQRQPAGMERQPGRQLEYLWL